METLVYVRAVARPGFDGFSRGGKRWPTSGALAFVSPALLAVIAKEPMLSVAAGEQTVSNVVDLDGIDPNTIEHLDLPVRSDVSVGANALEEVKKLDREIAEQEALAELAEKRKKLEKLKAANAKIAQEEAETALDGIDPAEAEFQAQLDAEQRRNEAEAKKAAKKAEAEAKKNEQR